MKKILFILHYPPPVHGAAMMGQYIKDSALVRSSFNSRYINLGTSAKVDEIGAGGFVKLYRYFKIVFQVLKLLISFKPNLVYFTLTATGSGFFKDATIVMLAKIFGKRVVYHLHNKGVSVKQNKWYYHICYKMVFRNAEVILLSPYLFDDVKRYVRDDKAHYCPNGVPDTMISVSVPEEKNKRVHLLFLSNLIESKGVLDLLEACRTIKTNKTDFRCTIIGGEADISAVQLQQHIHDKGLQAEVNYAGKRFGEAKALAYTEADIFVFPTYYPNECFPLVLLEAMQYELPVVSTYEGGIQDIVENGITGFLVEGQNVLNLAERIEKLIKEKALRVDFGKRGRKRYEEKFTLSVFETNFTLILATIMK